MKTMFRIAAIAAAVAFTVPAAAQDQAQGSRFGLGVGLTDGGLFPSGSVVFAPMAVSPTFRVEPFLSLSSQDFANDDSASAYALGAGAFYVKQIVPQVGLYVGGRLGLVFNSEKDDGAGTKASRRDTLLAAAIGGEYSPNPRFTFGAEAMLGRLGEGETTIKFDDGTPEQTADGGSRIGTQATLFARVYLF